MPRHPHPKGDEGASRDARQTSCETQLNPSRYQQPRPRSHDSPPSDLSLSTSALYKSAFHRQDRKVGPQLCLAGRKGARCYRRYRASIYLVPGCQAADSLCSYVYRISFAKIPMASPTSSSELKKWGEMRKPALGRQSTNTFFSASRSTIAGPFLTLLITVPPRSFDLLGVFNVQPCSRANAIIHSVRRRDSRAIAATPTASIISSPGRAE